MISKAKSEDGVSIVICEDDDKDRENLKAVLEDFFHDKCTFHLFSSGEELISSLPLPSMDLVFLDIFMEKMTGIETAHILRERDENAGIVFLTTSSDFAVESYDVDALGYLLKPLDKEKLYRLLDKNFTSKRRERICVNQRREIRYLYHDEIIYAESRGRSIDIHMANGDVICINEKLDVLETSLNNPSFLRTHQSFLVNMDFIEDVEEGAFIVKGGESVLIRTRDAGKIKGAYHKYFIETSLGGGRRHKG